MWLQYLLGVHNNLPRLAVFFLFVGTELVCSRAKRSTYIYLLNKQSLNAYRKEFKGHVRIIFQPLAA